VTFVAAVCVLALARSGRAASEAAPAPFAEGFEASNTLATAAVQGQVAIQRGSAFKGDACMTLTRAKVVMEKQRTEAALPTFPVREGLWDCGAALRSHLYSPDSSYNGTARLEVLDAAGKSLNRIELAIATADSPWKTYRKRVELPADASSARFILSMEKTYGEFAVDELSAVYAGPVLRTVRAIKFASTAVGNLFLPEQPLRFDVTAECTRPRPESERVATCVIRDYWGAEFTTPLRVKLSAAGTNANGRIAYAAVLDLTGRASITRFMAK